MSFREMGMGLLGFSLDNISIRIAKDNSSRHRAEMYNVPRVSENLLTALLHDRSPTHACCA